MAAVAIDEEPPPAEPPDVLHPSPTTLCLVSPPLRFTVFCLTAPHYLKLSTFSTETSIHRGRLLSSFCVVPLASPPPMALITWMESVWSSQLARSRSPSTVRVFVAQGSNSGQRSSRRLRHPFGENVVSDLKNRWCFPLDLGRAQVSPKSNRKLPPDLICLETDLRAQMNFPTNQKKLFLIATFYGLALKICQKSSVGSAGVTSQQSCFGQWFFFQRRGLSSPMSLLDLSSLRYSWQMSTTSMGSKLTGAAVFRVESPLAGFRSESPQLAISLIVSSPTFDKILKASVLGSSHHVDRAHIHCPSSRLRLYHSTSFRTYSFESMQRENMSLTLPHSTLASSDSDPTRLRSERHRGQRIYLPATKALLIVSVNPASKKRVAELMWRDLTVLP